MGPLSLDKAMIVQNLYGNAPLTAVALFDTEAACDVTVTVHGKTPEADITYTVGDVVTQHRVPIFGLYAGLENRVTITAGGESYDHYITADPIPDTVAIEITADPNNQTTEIADGQLYMLRETYYTVFDVNGDVRWYLGDSYSSETCEEPSGAVVVDEDMSGFWFGCHPNTGNPYSNNAEMVHINWIGKVSRVFSYQDRYSNHDATILPDGNILYYSKDDTLTVLDTKTGEIYDYLKMSDILDSSVGNINPENSSFYPGDWAHVNTVEYISDNNSLLLSLRNQHLVLNIDFDTKEILWAMTPAYSVVDGKVTAVQKSIQDYLILPDESDSDFEWFYSQHDPSFVSYDPEMQIFEFVVFDNGTYRYLTGEEPNSKQYSRLVHYSVNLNTRKVTQVFQYGKEEGLSLYSAGYGSADVIPQSGHYLGNFRGHNPVNPYSSIIVETDNAGTVIAKYFATIPTLVKGTYRVEALFLNNQSFSNCNFGDSSDDVYYYEYLQKNWSVSSAPQVSTESFSTFNLPEFSTDGNYLYTYGTAMVANSTNTIKFEMLAVDVNSNECYGFTMGTCRTTDGKFYGRGIPLDSLPDGQYLLYLRATNARGLTASQFTGYQLSRGSQQQPVAVQDILETQNAVNETLANACTSGNYPFDNPLVSVDPYGIAPLSAVVSFTTERPATIFLTVEGKNGAAPLTQQFETMTTEHQIPVYGLYAGESATVTLTAQYQEGTIASTTLSITGNALPDDFVPVGVVQADTAQMADGWTFLMAGSLQGYVYAIDEAGSVRWMFSEAGLGAASVFLPLENGNYLIGGDKSFGQYYKYSLFELNLTGQVVHEYMIDGYHHDAVELPSGNLLVLANNVNGDVMEDTIYELDRNTGEILRTWDFNGYFNVGNYNEAGQHVSDINYGASWTDWMHINGIDYNEQTDSLLISSRHQDAVLSFKLATGEIEWILSNPDDQWPEYLADKLLTPAGDGFEWQYGQHNAIWLPNGDVMLFDNGDYRSKTMDGVLNPATEAYSRAVIYHVDAQAKTVSQVWEFGKDKGPDHFAVNVSSVQYLGENHYLIDFGGIVKNSAGEATYSIMDGITGSSRSEVYEIKDGTVVFHANVSRQGLHGNTFRAVRLQPYASNEELDLTTVGTRLGSLYSRGLAQTIDFDSGIAISGGADVSVTDNGAQLVVSATLANSASNAAMIFASAQQDYRVALSGGSSIAYTLNKSEIPAGTYRLYLELDGTYYNLAQIWNNETNARANPTGYDVEVTASSESKGTVYGSGTYYANTPFTVSVKPSENAQFTGWYCNGALLSANATFSLTATEDMTLIAAFAGDDIGNQPGGGAGGGAGGGGAVGGEVAGKPSVSVNGAGGKADVADDGTVIITADAGYQIAKITVNSEKVEIPADGKLIGLDESDKVVVTFEKIIAVLPFTDVANDAWYTDAVQYVYENGMMNGTSATMFQPDAKTTRGMIVTMLYRLEGEPSANASAFTDVAADEWYADAVGWAAANGVVNGVSETAFAPDAPITREQMAAILYRFADWKDYDVSASQDLSAYSDAAQISAYAQTAMQWTNAEGLITGNTTTTLNPQGEATRAEVATILMRFCESIGNGAAA